MEEEDVELAPSLDAIQWSEFSGRQKSFEFTGKEGIQIEHSGKITAEESLSLFINNDILKLIANETNKYAEAKYTRIIEKHARGNSWTPTNEGEIKKLLGILI